MNGEDGCCVGQSLIDAVFSQPTHDLRFRRLCCTTIMLLLPLLTLRYEYDGETAGGCVTLWIIKPLSLLRCCCYCYGHSLSLWRPLSDCRRACW